MVVQCCHQVRHRVGRGVSSPMLYWEKCHQCVLPCVAQRKVSARSSVLSSTSSACVGEVVNEVVCPVKKEISKLVMCCVYCVGKEGRVVWACRVVAAGDVLGPAAEGGWQDVLCCVVHLRQATHRWQERLTPSTPLHAVLCVPSVCTSRNVTLPKV